MGDRNKNSSGRKEERTSINDNHNSHSLAIKGYRIPNHKVYGRIKVGINAESRALTFFKFMECQRSDGTRIVRWWTEIDPNESTSSEPRKEEVKTNTKIFAPNLTKSDQINQVLAEGMTEKDKFLYENGGGAEAMWKLIELEAQQKVSPQNSKASGKKVTRVVTKRRGKMLPTAGPHKGAGAKNKDNLSSLTLPNNRWPPLLSNHYNHYCSIKRCLAQIIGSFLSKNLRQSMLYSSPTMLS